MVIITGLHLYVKSFKLMWIRCKDYITFNNCLRKEIHLLMKETISWDDVSNSFTKYSKRMTIYLNVFGIITVIRK